MDTEAYEDVVEATIQQQQSVAQLKSMNLTALPPSLMHDKNIEALTELYLDYNNLSHLPSEIGKLGNLHILSINGNGLQDLPLDMANLVKLNELHLSENRLTVLPKCVSKLTNLTVLNVIGNQMIELDEDIGNLKKLQVFNLDENSLKELPISFCQLEELKVLECPHNRLKSLPPDCGNLRQLKVCNMAHNAMRGDVQESFGQLSNLELLDLSNNQLDGWCSQFKSARTIRMLFLECNHFYNLAEWFADLPNLVEMNISLNNLNLRPLPENMERNMSLKKLDFGGNFIQELSPTLGNLVNLEWLRLGSTWKELERRDHLRKGNWIEELPESITQLRNLKDLRLDENYLLKLPETIGDLCSLTRLDLGQNDISVLPESFCRLACLTWCQLSFNKLDFLPQDFGNLERLTYLRLGNNPLSELPQSFERLVNLVNLDLYMNELKCLPECLTRLTKLKALDLRENEFPLDEELPEMMDPVNYAVDEAKKRRWRSNKKPPKKGADFLSNALKNTDVFWKVHGQEGDRKRNDVDVPKDPVEEEECWDYLPPATMDDVDSDEVEECFMNGTGELGYSGFRFPTPVEGQFDDAD